MKRFQVTVNGTAYDVQVQEIAEAAPVAAPAPAAAAPAPKPAPAPAPAPKPAPVPAALAPAAETGAVKVTAPMPGNIWDVRCSVGQSVAKGDVLVVLEAMKMQNEIVAPSEGKVAGIHVSKGATVDTGALMVSLN